MALWRELTARGFECFYPQLHVHPVNPRSRKTQPYFPGYLFLHADIEVLGVSTIEWMPFSRGLVSFDGIPAAVSASLLQRIRQQVDETNAIGNEKLTGLKQGEAVVIEGGPFDGYEALFDARLPDKGRVRVLLKLLQTRQMNVELPTTQIQRKKPR